jgi:hypothetical protein
MLRSQTAGRRSWQRRDAVAMALLCIGASVHAVDAAPSKGRYDGVAAAIPTEKSRNQVASQDPKVSGKRAALAVEAWCLCALTIEEAVFLKQYDFQMNAR